ncbi:ornithine cyclodeaminase family protein [Brevibacillus humidisoli]|uniref:ornithine cyclodeaminase family protein n=1 Tax=Brevibacillus humidisoli TaxID=2895522 RepID=UPI001E4298DF|nr:ornithine cyclodeaminase family protein [Brevibacillus humidisoli]UFJ39638.1 ornithine cyclodeaminase family protein [Brevibacillus humidisoli]
MTEVLLISQQQVKEVLGMKKMIGIVEQVWRAHGSEQVLMPSKITLDLGEGNDWPPYGGSFNAMPAYIGEQIDISGIKWVCGFEGNRAKGLPYISGTILLNDPRTGELLAVMDGSYITDYRTGAATGVAVKYLAKQDAKVVGIIGAGIQARTNLTAIAELIPVEKVHIIDINKEVAQQFAADMSRELNVEVVVAERNQDVAEEADILVTVTTANKPLVMKEWVKEGALVISVGSFQELDDQIPLRADKLVVDNWEQNAHRGELVKLVEAGRLTQAHIHAEMPDIVTHKKAGRENDKEIICACLIGMGSTDIGIAHAVYRDVKASGNYQTFRVR